jgi:hypothetical protein
LREGEGDTSGIAEVNPQQPEPISPTSLEGEGTNEIKDIGSVIKSP